MSNQKSTPLLLTTPVSHSTGVFGAVLPSGGNWTANLQDMRLCMNITSRGNSRKEVFEFRSVNDTYTRYVLELADASFTYTYTDECWPIMQCLAHHKQTSWALPMLCPLLSLLCKEPGQFQQLVANSQVPKKGVNTALTTSSHQQVTAAMNAV